MSVDLDLEQELRRTFGDGRRTLPVWPDAAERVGAGVRRRRRRRTGMAVVAGAAVAVVLIGVPGALWRGAVAPDGRVVPAAPSSSSIPWVDTPEVDQPALARRSPRPERSACPGTDAVTDAVWIEDGPTTADYLVRTILIGNPSDRRCTRTGTPQLIATDAVTGVRAPLSTQQGTPVDGGIKQYPATVDPGEPARLDVVTVTGCAATAGPTRYRDVAVVVAGREYQLKGVELQTACPVRVGSWYVQPPLLNAPLTVTLQAPAQARRGTWYEYTVTVLNVQPRPVALSPCPVFTQRLGGTPGSGGYHRLNCAVQQVPPNRPVRFTMKLPVAPDTPLGPAKLRWMAVLAGGEVALAEIASDGATVEVVD